MMLENNETPHIVLEQGMPHFQMNPVQDLVIWFLLEWQEQEVMERHIIHFIPEGEA